LRRLVCTGVTVCGCFQFTCVATTCTFTRPIALPAVTQAISAANVISSSLDTLWRPCAT
jgi:hypothetical protein